RPSIRVAGHGQAPCRSGRQWPSHLQGGDRLWSRPPVGATTRRGSRLQRGTRRSGDLQYSAHSQRRSPAGTTPVGGPTDQVAWRGDATSPQELPLEGNKARPWAEAATG
ncbi:hypothetical protein GW17_00040681, partial [Ensete ventricosum]